MNSRRHAISRVVQDDAESARSAAKRLLELLGSDDPAAVSDAASACSLAAGRLAGSSRLLSTEP